MRKTFFICIVVIPRGDTPPKRQGDVVRIVNTSGATMVTYTYDAWGKVTIIPQNTVHGRNIANANPLLYRGYYYDSELEMYYLQSRYYDPQIGRFINADSYASTGQGFLGYNMFAYCRNNPVCKNDISGLRDEDVTQDEEKDDEVNGTISFGIAGNFSLFGFWGFGGQFCISMDFKGNIQIQYSLEGGLTTGDLSGSLMAYTMVTNAPDVSKLTGPGYQIGCTVPTSAITAVGYDFNILEDVEENTAYVGSTFSIGGVIPSATPEGHVYWGETKTLAAFTYDPVAFWNGVWYAISGGWQ